MSKKYKYQFTVLGAPDGSDARPVLQSATRYSRKDALSFLKGKGIKASDLPKEKEEYTIPTGILEFKKIAI